MDAHALLVSQGWRGKGHSLHGTDDSVGLSRPLLLSRKDNTVGLGQRPHFTSDQWWMNAFDEQLKGLDTSKDGEVRQTVTNGKLNAIDSGALGRWCLYTSFVKGGYLEGTTHAETETGASSTDSDSATPNTAAPEPAERETREERRARRAERKAQRAERRAQRAERRVQRAERRARAGDRRLRKEKRAQARAARAARRAAEASKSPPGSETDDRRRKRRAAKEASRRRRKEQETTSQS